MLQCLEALSHQSYDRNYEILVVYHEGDVIETLKSRFDDVQWILNKKAPNPYRSRNLGAQEASGTYYCFLDARCVPQKDWFLSMDQYIQEHPGENIFAGQINVIPQGTKLRDSVHGLMYLNNKKNIERSYGVPAGHLVVHRTIFSDYGCFDTQSKSGNDIIYTKNLVETGVPIHYVHEAIVDYKGFDYTQLKTKMRKYAKGVVGQNNTSFRQILSGFFPMRLRLFNDSLHYRNMDSLSFVEKWRLWLLVWRLKVHFALNLMQAQLHYYFGASRDKA